MRILCLAVLLGALPQLLKKFDAEVRGLRAAGAEVDAFVMGPGTARQTRGHAFRYVSRPFDRAIYMTMAESLAQEHPADVIYFRYPAATRQLAAFMRRHDNVVFEHNTIEESELLRQELVDERRWGAECVRRAAGICAVTGEIARYELGRMGRDAPAFVLGNGIDPADVPPPTIRRPDDGAIHLLCAAWFSSWHGLDRLIRGMAAHAGPERFVLHLAGDGAELAACLALAEELGLGDRVVAHGMLRREELDALAATCHLGVGALGIHRKSLAEQAAIKHREYCLQGLPFFFGGRDADFDPVPEFARALPGDESPADMAVVAELARWAEATPDAPARMRRYAEERLSWESKTRRLFAFLEDVAARRGAAPAVSVSAGEEGILTPVVALAEADARGAEWTRLTLASLKARAAASPGTCREIVLSGPEAALRMAAEAWTELFGADSEVRRTDAREDSGTWWMRLNTGMDAASGRWLLPLRAGDEAREGVFDAPPATARRRPEISLITAGAVTPAGESWTPLGFPNLRLGMDAPEPCLILRRSLWRDAGPYRDSHPLGLVEWLFWLSCFHAGMDRRALPRPGLMRRAPMDPLLPPRHEGPALDMLVSMRPRVFSTRDVLNVHPRIARATDLLAAAERAAERHPDAAWLRFCLGLFAEARGCVADALALHMTAARLDPDDWQPHLRMAFLHRALGRRAAMERARREAFGRWAELEDLWRELEES